MMLTWDILVKLYHNSGVAVRNFIYFDFKSAFRNPFLFLDNPNDKRDWMELFLGFRQLKIDAVKVHVSSKLQASICFFSLNFEASEEVPRNQNCVNIHKLTHRWVDDIPSEKKIVLCWQNKKFHFVSWQINRNFILRLLTLLNRIIRRNWVCDLEN